ncbi:hypothetical protein Lal_00026818 [Lupinus albus]|nr:hypothetical protein Lal_00026818 [Lupinus albus]
MANMIRSPCIEYGQNGLVLLRSDVNSTCGNVVDVVILGVIRWEYMLLETLVNAAKTIKVISSVMGGSNNGSLQLMYQELQVLSPHVSTREFHFLHYSQEIEKGTWAIVDVSYDNPQDKQCMPQFRSHRFPSGCLIQNMPNGQHFECNFIEKQLK